MFCKKHDFSVQSAKLLRFVKSDWTANISCSLSPLLLLTFCLSSYPYRWQTSAKAVIQHLRGSLRSSAVCPLAQMTRTSVSSGPRSGDEDGEHSARQNEQRIIHTKSKSIGPIVVTRILPSQRPMRSLSALPPSQVSHQNLVVPTRP